MTELMKTFMLGGYRAGLELREFGDDADMPSTSDRAPALREDRSIYSVNLVFDRETGRWVVGDDQFRDGVWRSAKGEERVTVRLSSAQRDDFKLANS